MKFWVPWAVDVLVASIALAGGSLWLKLAGRRTAATILALVLAVRAVLAALFFLPVVLSGPRWN